jgi:hypothetical protein
VEPETGVEVLNAYKVLETAGWIALATLGAIWVWRGMQQPRLRLEETPGGLRTTWRSTVYYIVTAPFLVSVWWIFFFVILFLAPGTRSPVTLLLMPLALIMAVRLLAHISELAAYHLGNVVPMVVIAAILLGNSLPDEETAEEMFDSLGSVKFTYGAALVVFVAEYVFAIIWYFWKTRRAGHPGPDPRAPEWFLPGSRARRKRERRQAFESQHTAKSGIHEGEGLHQPATTITNPKDEE